MRHPNRVLIGLALAAAGMASNIDAQTTRSTREPPRVVGGVSWVSLWDDETFLGRGVLVSGGVAQPLGGHVVVEGEVAWATHHRDAGYLAAAGTPIVGTARLSYVFGSRDRRARPFVSAGLAIVYSTGRFTTRTFLVNPGGLLLEGPAIQRDWSLTRPALEAGCGVAMASGERLWFRPEIRWTSTGAAGSSPATVEPPLWIIRTGLTVEWRTRR